MAAPTLQDLLTPRDQPTIAATLLASLQAAPIVGGTVNSFPVTDWAPGGFERTMINMIATGLVSEENIIPMLTAGGFLDFAATITDGNGNLIEGWLELLAAQNFDIPRADATFAQQMLALTCTTGPGPYTRNPGEIVAKSPSTGNAYANVNAVTVPDGGSVSALFQAQTAGAIVQDAANSIIVLVTPMPGVSVNNPVTVAGTPVSALTGTGTIAVYPTIITPNPRMIQITFTTAGRVSDHSASFTCTVYQGNAVTTTGPFVLNATFYQGDEELVFTDGPTGTTSFNLGDSWTVGVPGTPQVQTGTAKESLAMLNQECHDRWPSLSAIPTAGRIEGLVFACSKASSLGITKVISSPSTTVAGVQNVYIASDTATATTAQVVATQAYLDARNSLISTCDAAAAVATAITPSGIVQCHRGTTAAVQKAANAAWTAYIATMPIGGTAPDSLVEVAELETVLMNAGAHNTNSLGFVGSSVGQDIVLAANAVATIGALPYPALTWQEVA